MGTRHRTKRRPPTELHFGYNYSRGRVPQVGASAKHSRLFRIVFGVSFAAAMLAGVLAAWSAGFGFFDALGAIGALGRGVAMLMGVFALPLALIYYYSAGIDWPMEEASRLVMIGASLALVLWVGVLFIGRHEGWSDWPSTAAWSIAGALALLAIGGYIGQRSG